MKGVSLVEILIVLAILGVIGFFLIGIVALKRAPLLKAHAKVIAKSKEVSGGGDQQVGSLFVSAPIKTTYYIALEFDNRRESVKIDVSQYNTLNENDTGVLEYKDAHGKFIFYNFKRDA